MRPAWALGLAGRIFSGLAGRRTMDQSGAASLLDLPDEGKTMSSTTSVAVNHYRWDDMPAESLKGGLTRKLITGERMMIDWLDGTDAYLRK